MEGYDVGTLKISCFRKKAWQSIAHYSRLFYMSMAEPLLAYNARPKTL
jgi:hypothetical protein